MIIEFLADGFEDVEALAPLDLLRRAGDEVITVSLNDENTATSSHNVTYTTDKKLSDLNDLAALPEMIILPGGMPGAKNLRACPQVCGLVMNVLGNGGHIAAICAAPFILGELGFLNGVKCTCFPGFEKKLTGGIVADTSDGGKVVTDGQFTTASGMGMAIRFGIELVSVLHGKETAEKMQKSIMS